MRSSIEITRSRARRTGVLGVVLAAFALAAPGPATADPVLNPEVQITGGPTGETRDRNPSFTFSSEDTDEFECRLNQEEFAGCTSPFTAPTLVAGDHSFEVRGVGLIGRSDPPARREFRVVIPPDRDAPDTTITQGVRDKGTTSDPTPTFEFESNERGARFQCLLDSFTENDFFSCDSPYTTPELSEGGHVFAVRAKDEAGNVDPSPEFRAFTIDLTPDAQRCFGRDVTVLGDSDDDRIEGTRGDDVISGAAGNDTIDGLEGKDRICGGEGDDILIGGKGNDRLAGRNGNDELDGGRGVDLLAGNAGADVLRGGGADDDLAGNVGRDRLSGDSGDDRLTGGSGQDLCDGGAGKDKAKSCERSIGIP
jgi:hypothetical protein